MQKNYTIGIKELTLNSGFYQLIVKTIGIKDLLGNEGKNGKSNFLVTNFR
jgi:hypothetical protein